MTTETGRAPELESNGLAWRVALLVPILVAAVAAILWLPALASVRDRFAHADGTWVAIAFVLQLASTLSFVAAFRGAFESRVSWRAAFDLSMVEEGTNVFLPSGGSGGLALGAVILVRAGVPVEFTATHTAVLFLVTSAVSLVALVLAGGLEAVGILGGHTSLFSSLVPAVAAAAVLLAAAILPRRLPPIAAQEGQRVRTILARTQHYLHDSVALSLVLLRRRDLLLIGGAVGYFAFDIASLAASFEALGHGALPIGTLTLAYVIGHGGALIPLPGSAEGGLVGAFTGYGAPLSLAVGAILVYRTFHAGVPMVLALVGYADIRRLRRTGPSPEELAERFS